MLLAGLAVTPLLAALVVLVVAYFLPVEVRVGKYELVSYSMSALSARSRVGPDPLIHVDLEQHFALFVFRKPPGDHVIEIHDVDHPTLGLLL